MLNLMPTRVCQNQCRYVALFVLSPYVMSITEEFLTEKSHLGMQLLIHFVPSVIFFQNHVKIKIIKRLNSFIERIGILR